MSGLDDLMKKERNLSEQLDDAIGQRVRAEQLHGDFEWYDSDSRFAEQELWEAAFQSKYAWQLEDMAHQMRQLKSQMFDDLEDYVEGLKKDERQLEDKLDDIYYKKQKEVLKEEEKHYGH
ncbi:DUF3958 family protein [Streptococcus caballi]|uniref:DUF3958 family protein n=1 Tax=Streptococcus caballi TaxID=439220 RepID=UPI0003819660|nr:DUF3958 family protein [Streptococcus caballi]